MKKLIALTALAGLLTAGCASKETDRGRTYSMIGSGAATDDAGGTFDASPDSLPSVGTQPDAEPDNTPGDVVPPDSGGSDEDMAPPGDSSGDSDPSIFVPRNKNRSILI